MLGILAHTKYSLNQSPARHAHYASVDVERLIFSIINTENHKGMQFEDAEFEMKMHIFRFFGTSFFFNFLVALIGIV